MEFSGLVLLVDKVTEAFLRSYSPVSVPQEEEINLISADQQLLLQLEPRQMLQS